MTDTWDFKICPKKVKLFIPSQTSITEPLPASHAKVFEERDTVLHLYHQHPAQCLTYNKDSVNVCLINNLISECASK